MIVAIEGIDASGKETQVRKLQQWARSEGADFGILDSHDQDFPDYDNLTGKAIGDLLRGRWSVITNERGDKPHMKALVMQCLMVTNRLEHGEMLRHYAGRRNNLLILDRYHASGQVYGRSDGLSSVWLEKIHYLLPEPDLWVLVDISVEESFRRRPERQDYYERNAAQLEEVRELYLGLFAEHRNRGDTHWHVIDGADDVGNIHEELKALVIKRLETWS